MGLAVYLVESRYTLRIDGTTGTIAASVAHANTDHGLDGFVIGNRLYLVGRQSLVGGVRYTGRVLDGGTLATVSAAWGPATNVYPFGTPLCTARHSDNIYVGYTDGGLAQLNSAGTVLEQWILPARPYRIAVAPDGTTLYWLEQGIYATEGRAPLRRFDLSTGSDMSDWSGTVGTGPSDLMVHPSTGDVFIVQYAAEIVTRYNAAGTVIRTWDAFTFGLPLDNLLRAELDASNNYFWLAGDTVYNPPAQPVLSALYKIAIDSNIGTTAPVANWDAYYAVATTAVMVGGQRGLVRGGQVPGRHNVRGGQRVPGTKRVRGGQQMR